MIHLTSLALTCGPMLLGACAPQVCIGDCNDGGTAGSPEDELASLQRCSVPTTIDTSSCGDGIAQPGELCLGPGTLVPLLDAPGHPVAGDFDGDGDTDLLWVAEPGYIEGRAGDAAAPLAAALPGARPALGPGDPQLTDAGDLDGDGRLDVVANDGYALLMRGDGLGGLGSSEEVYPSAPVWGPTILPTAGGLDLVVIDPSAPVDAVLLVNDGAGSFTAMPQFDDGDPGTRFPIAVGDFDGVAPFDRFTGLGGEVRLQARSGLELSDTTLPLAADYLHVRGLEVTDLDGDGHMDLVMSLLDHDHRNSQGFEIYESLAVYLADGPPIDGVPAFDEGAYLPLDCSASSMALGDVDGDSNLDVVTSHYPEPDSGQPASLMVRRGDGLGGFSEVARFPTPVGFDTGGELVLGDYDGDGRLDVAVLDSNDAAMALYLGID